MNVLFMNLTRFGDLLQTQPCISAARAQGHKVGLVCLENFVSAAGLLRDVERAYGFPGAKVLAALDSDWLEGVKASSQFKKDVAETFLPQAVVNLTPSVSSRLMARDLATAREPQGSVVGFGVDEFGFNADTSSWAAFLQTAGANRGASPFNVCDLFLKTAGLLPDGTGLRLADPDENAMREAEDIMTGMAGEQGYIALQPGASEERRRWPVSHFARVAQMASAAGFTPVILGTAGEAHLGERIAAEAGVSVLNLQGKTSLPVLAAVLRKCRALVSNDTGTMHLAAGMGTPVAAIFLATAQPWDTGPYRAGSLSFEPDLECHPCGFGTDCPYSHKCRETVSPEVVWSHVSRMLGLSDAVEKAGARVWESGFAADGFMTLSSLSGHGDSDRARWILMQRQVYRRFLDGESLDDASAGCAAPGPDMAEPLSATLSACVEMLFLLQQQAMLLARTPRQALKDKFLAGWQRLEQILMESKHVDVLARLWVFESQTQGGDVAQLVKLAGRYHALCSSLLRALS